MQRSKTTPKCCVAQSAGVVEHTDCIYAEGQDSLNECPVIQSAEAVEYADCISTVG